MGKLIIIILLVLLVIHSVALVGFFGYGVATGRFDSSRREQYLATWRGDKLISPPPEEVVEEKQENAQEASARIFAIQLEREYISREMDLYARQLRNKQVTVAAAQAKLEKDLSQLNNDEVEFNKKVAEQNRMAREEGFKKVVCGKMGTAQEKSLSCHRNRPSDCG